MAGQTYCLQDGIASASVRTYTGLPHQEFNGGFEERTASCQYP